jgi:hypothetical protein
MHARAPQWLKHISLAKRLSLAGPPDKTGGAKRLNNFSEVPPGTLARRSKRRRSPGRKYDRASSGLSGLRADTNGEVCLARSVKRRATLTVSGEGTEALRSDRTGNARLSLPAHKRKSPCIGLIHTAQRFLARVRHGTLLVLASTRPWWHGTYE